MAKANGKHTFADSNSLPETREELERRIQDSLERSLHRGGTTHTGDVLPRQHAGQWPIRSTQIPVVSSNTNTHGRIIGGANQATAEQTIDVASSSKIKDAGEDSSDLYVRVADLPRQFRDQILAEVKAKRIVPEPVELGEEMPEFSDIPDVQVHKKMATNQSFEAHPHPTFAAVVDEREHSIESNSFRSAGSRPECHESGIRGHKKNSRRCSPSSTGRKGSPSRSYRDLPRMPPRYIEPAGLSAQPTQDEIQMSFAQVDLQLLMETKADRGQSTAKPHAGLSGTGRAQDSPARKRRNRSSDKSSQSDKVQEVLYVGSDSSVEGGEIGEPTIMNVIAIESDDNADESNSVGDDSRFESDVPSRSSSSVRAYSPPLARHAQHSADNLRTIHRSPGAAHQSSNNGNSRTSGPARSTSPMPKLTSSTSGSTKFRVDLSKGPQIPASLTQCTIAPENVVGKVIVHDPVDYYWQGRGEQRISGEHYGATLGRMSPSQPIRSLEAESKGAGQQVNILPPHLAMRAKNQILAHNNTLLSEIDGEEHGNITYVSSKIHYTPFRKTDAESARLQELEWREAYKHTVVPQTTRNPLSFGSANRYWTAMPEVSTTIHASRAGTPGFDNCEASSYGLQPRTASQQQ